MFNLTWLTEVDWAYFLGMFATFAMASAQFRAQWSCPLRKPCPLYPRKRTFDGAKQMSALGQ
jgi:hypothetical protein